MLLTTERSDVFIQEQDLSQVVRLLARTVGAITCASKKGPLNPVKVFGAQDFNNRYGTPDPSISFAHYSALHFLADADELWVNRVAGAGFRYGGTMLTTDSLLQGMDVDISLTGTVSTVLATTGVLGVGTVFTTELVPGDRIEINGEEQIVATITDDLNLDVISVWAATNVGLPATKLGPDAPSDPDNVSFRSFDVLQFTGIGPGDYVNGQIFVRIVSQNIVAPTGIVATPVITGGTLSDATYNYRVSAVNDLGETLASTAVPAIVAGAGGLGSVSIAWTAIPEATGYRVYGRVGGSELLLSAVDASLTVFVDIGAITPVGALPVTAPTPTTQFKTNIFDSAISTSNPVETFDTTLEREIDGFGVQLEIEDVINNNSSLIRVKNNTIALLSVPTIFSTPAAATLFAGGNDGATITNSDLILGWDKFISTEIYDPTILINAGSGTNPAVQLKMDAVCQSRQDAVCILDVPPTQQAPNKAIDYRRLTLNLNSNRAMLVSPDTLQVDPFNNFQLFVPQSGKVAGRMAFTDRISNPGRSPAGPNRGIYSETLGVRFNYNDGEREVLARNRVNYARVFPGGGIILWEQFTLQDKFSALSFMNVRRIVDIIEQSIKVALRFSLQEPSDDFTRSQIVQIVTEFLDSLKTARILEDFGVQSDLANNPPAVRSAGQLNLDIFLIPILPAQKILLTANIVRSGVNISTLIEGQN